ncbi:hypothetical protein ACFLZV_06780, partial [Candidatus Margulisiibacteriota bacterium]
GRKQAQENKITDVTHLPYLSWDEWIFKLAEFKIATHLMPTFAAGTFAMNCGFLGIPCIGYEELDTQRFIHPYLSVKNGDLENAKKLALKLSSDQDFWNNCSKCAKNNFVKYYSESSFAQAINPIFPALS